MKNGDDMITVQAWLPGRRSRVAVRGATLGLALERAFALGAVMIEHGRQVVVKLGDDYQVFPASGRTR